MVDLGGVAGTEVNFDVGMNQAFNISPEPVLLTTHGVSGARSVCRDVR